MTRDICLHHHERWDGSGYPLRLAGEAIPLAARIMSFADVYDALLFRRVYKPAFNAQVTRGETRTSAGSRFDPFIAETMLDNIVLFEEIDAKYREG